LVEKKPATSIVASLYSKNLIFDYATIYASKNKSIKSAKEYVFTDADYQDFMKWLEGKDYDYITKVESTLDDLEAISKTEKYYDGIKNQLESLRKQMGHNKDNDLITFKVEIKEMLEEEIVSRYYLQKGLIEASFDDDEDIQAALKVLNNPVEYSKILSGK
jgi:carboxyl-terminal processing protease